MSGAETAPGDGHGDDAVTMLSHAIDLFSQAWQTGDADALEQAVTGFQYARAAAPPGSPVHESASINLANALAAKFTRTGDAGFLDEAIALASKPFTDRKREADRLAAQGWAQQLKAAGSGDRALMKKAVASRQRALNRTRKSDQAYPDRLSDLGNALIVQYTMTGDPTDLVRAVGDLEGAVARTSAGDPKAAGLLSSLGNALIAQAGVTGDPAVLARAVDSHRRAVQAADAGDPYNAMYLSNLGDALLREHEERRSRSVLEEAMRRHREAVALIPAGHVELAPRLANLAATLLTAYERTSEQDLLEEGVATYRKAAASAAGQPEYRARYLYGLAGTLFRQAERTGDLASFEEIITLLEEVLQLTPVGHPNRPNRLAALGSAKFSRFREDPSDLTLLDDGIDALREAKRLAPIGHTERGRILSNLGGLLDSRFEYTADLHALDEATTAHREALAATSAEHSELGMRLSNLVISLVHQSRAREDDSVLDEAIGQCQAALEAMPRGEHGRSLTLQALGATYARRHELTGDADAAAAGVVAFLEATDDQTAPARTRILAGRDGGRLAAAAGLNAEALRAFASAVRLLDEAAWVGLTRADQERLLGRVTGLPSDAAAMAITEGRLEYAIELLEQGRGVLLAKQLEAPDQSMALHERAPELAEQLRRVRSALDLTGTDDPVGADEPSARAVEPAAHMRRIELARQRDELIEQIRSRGDLQDIITPPTFSRLAAAADHGPVVIINISGYRCDALIVTGGTVQLLPLLQVSADAVAEQAEKLMQAADNAKRGIDPVLEWIWDQIVSPVFTSLGLESPPAAGEQIPHIWWCPTGIASFLPLHAAGRYQGDGPWQESALNMAVSSYTPALRILVQLRERPAGAIPAAAGPLIIAMPQTNDALDLPGSETEASDLAARFSRSTYLTGDKATHAAVTQAMGEHPWAHFACHGVQDLIAPSRGRLMLHDKPLTIPQLMTLRLESPSFAFLSACETYRGGTLVPDEGITLATALQLAGYQHVIGTLWQIGIVAPDVSRHFYDKVLTRSGDAARLNADNAAAALRSGILALLAESPGIPTLHWAPYIHTGP